MDFKTGSFMILSALALRAAAAELPAGVVAVPMIRNEKLDAYLAEFGVGTPPQKEYLKVDTGSPRYSFLDARNSVCARPSKPCSTYGTFDNLTSSYVITVYMFYFPVLITDLLEPAITRNPTFRML